MDSIAEMGCLLKVNAQCDSCKMHVIEVLRSICGVYSVTIDGKEGTVKVTGEVDPSVLMRALAKTGKHAELVWVKLTSSAKTRGYANNKYGSYGYAALPQPHPSLQHYPPRRPHIEYPWYNTNYHY